MRRAEFPVGVVDRPTTYPTPGLGVTAWDKVHMQMAGNARFSAMRK